MSFMLIGVRTEYDQFYGIVYKDETSYRGVMAIGYICIKTQYQRTGMCTRLVRHLEEEANNSNRALVFICVAPDGDDDLTDSPMYKLLYKLGYRYMDQTIHMCKNPDLVLEKV